MSTTITISRTEYDILKADSEELSVLEAAGVDNWRGYDDAMKSLNRRREYAEKVSQLTEDLLSDLTQSVEYPAGVEAGAGFTDTAYDYIERYYKERLELEAEYYV